MEIFATSMQDIEYQLNKTEKLATDPATVVPKYYYDFLNIFLKEASDKVLSYSKYHHNIELLQDGKIMAKQFSKACQSHSCS